MKEVSMFTLREYNPEKDGDAVIRIFEEAGWIEKGREEKKNQQLKQFLRSATAYVAEWSGNAECFVATAPGSYRYLQTDLDFCGVMAVLTSRIARKQNLATQLTGLSLARAAENGAAISGLGIFDQGFYNKLGFGNGPYEHHVTFNPANLAVGYTQRIPHRLSSGDLDKIHQSRLSRLRKHGAINFYPPEVTFLHIFEEKKGFGLGFFDESSGELTAHMWLKAEKEHGPYQVAWTAFRSHEQFLELLSLVKNLSDQVFAVTMREPPGIQLQDLLKKPFTYEEITSGSEYKNTIHTAAYYQLRILDLERCIRATTLKHDELHFNLTLHDPIEQHLPEGTSWKGVGGAYTIMLGPESDVRAGHSRGLPVLEASVGAFTRMWLGILQASSLAVTDELRASQELLDRLDNAFLLPPPKTDWDF